MATTCRRITSPRVLCLALPLLLATVAWAQDPATTETAPRISLWNVVASGGIIGYLILVMSLAAGALIVEHFLSIRRERLLPGEFIAALQEELQHGRYDEARELCQQDDSYLARVIAAGLGQVGAMFGFFDMQTTMQEVSEREISRYQRKLEYLSFIASTAPMMGLLGTVTGMIRAFNEIARAQGAAQPAQLAAGISEALVTTCLGLVVAIPTMFFVAFFRNRLESYVAEAETVVDKLMGRFRRHEAA